MPPRYHLITVSIFGAVVLVGCLAGWFTYGIIQLLFGV